MFGLLLGVAVGLGVLEEVFAAVPSIQLLERHPRRLMRIAGVLLEEQVLMLRRHQYLLVRILIHVCYRLVYLHHHTLRFAPFVLSLVVSGGALPAHLEAVLIQGSLSPTVVVIDDQRLIMALVGYILRRNDVLREPCELIYEVRVAPTIPHSRSLFLPLLLLEDVHFIGRGARDDRVLAAFLARLP